LACRIGQWVHIWQPLIGSSFHLRNLLMELLCTMGLARTETNRIRLVLSGMQNRTSGPYLAAVNRILISLIGNCPTAPAGNNPFALPHQSTPAAGVSAIPIRKARTGPHHPALATLTSNKQSLLVYRAADRPAERKKKSREIVTETNENLTQAWMEGGWKVANPAAPARSRLHLCRY
jgi:hypothetical protein